MLKLKFITFAIYTIFASQAFAHDTFQIVEGECNNMGMMGSECDSLSVVKVKQMTPEMPLSLHSHTAFHQSMDYSMLIMNNAMKNAPMTGNADDDFAAMMIPHHQGAVDMAKLELLYGQDPALKRLAQEIIVTQGSEIAVMQMHLGQTTNNMQGHHHD